MFIEEQSKGRPLKNSILFKIYNEAMRFIGCDFSNNDSFSVVSQKFILFIEEIAIPKKVPNWINMY